MSKNFCGDQVVLLEKRKFRKMYYGKINCSICLGSREGVRIMTNEQDHIVDEQLPVCERHA